MNKILNKISFDDAKNLIETTSTQLYKTQKYKILCLGLFSIFLSLLTVNNSVWTSLILKLSTLMIVLIVTGIQFYRLNKSWLSQSTNETGLLVIENKWLGTAIFLIIIAIIFLIVLVFSLLPTMIFNKKIFVEGIVLKKFSEEFRQEYGFTKQEWYGEDS